MSTTDPAQIPNAAVIPPQGATFAGVSPGLVAVCSGTLPGDTDAAPGAKELLARNALFVPWPRLRLAVLDILALRELINSLESGQVPDGRLQEGCSPLAVTTPGPRNTKTDRLSDSIGVSSLCNSQGGRWPSKICTPC
jgi:hypothetical protein